MGKTNEAQLGTVLYTVDEVSKLLHTNANYVHKLRKAKLMPFLKIGCYKVRKETLESFLKEYDGYDLTDPFNPVPLEEDK